MKKFTALQIASIIAVIVVLVLFAAFLMTDLMEAASGTSIVLPSDPDVTTAAGIRDEVWENGTVMQDVKVTTDNVAQVIMTLSRPESYTLTATVERSSGEQLVRTKLTHAVHGELSASVSVTDERESHTLRDGSNVCLWEDGREPVTLREGAFGADAAAGIPTYEVVQELESVDSAGYTVYEGFDCITFSAFDPALSLTVSYYVDIATGLLIASESVCQGQIIYRMYTETITLGQPDASLFVLPDGRSLLD